ncbi:DUF3347 domain-containing protein [Sphingobacterium sp. xlx-130]|uniref:DUF3347 domain-containing protein n=1 Tax=Sphingobacterium sp. xlx-130 TaxID=2654323 RepID=UPI001F09FF84|nr:DUF3347 domain-containing protein [Sphingobacterium sp. xlx-130]
MKSLSKILMVIVVLLSVTKSFAQNQNEQHHKGQMPAVTSQNLTQLQAIFDKYFSIKDALVSADTKKASSNATALAAAIKALDMGKLSAEEHTVWMKVRKELSLNTESIVKSKELVKQRTALNSLSKNIYELAKVSNLEATIYYQQCSMYNNGKGGTWLSKSPAIKNPYYGSKMLSCGRTIEKLN